MPCATPCEAPMAIRFTTTGMLNRVNADRECCLRLQNQTCDRIMTWLKANATPPCATTCADHRPVIGLQGISEPYTLRFHERFARRPLLEKRPGLLRRRQPANTRGFGVVEHCFRDFFPR